jgi:hypothetical protein
VAAGNRQDNGKASAKDAKSIPSNDRAPWLGFAYSRSLSLCFLPHDMYRDACEIRQVRSPGTPQEFSTFKLEATVPSFIGSGLLVPVADS